MLYESKVIWGMKDKVKLNRLKKRIFDIIQIGNREDFPSLSFDIGIVCVIVLSIAVTFMQTFDEFAGISQVLNIIEMVTMIIFLVEYILRLWTANYLYPGKTWGMSVITFVFSFYGLVDLLTILPYFLPFFLPSGAVAFRMLRVVRILHLFRINATYDAFNVITDVLKEKKNQLISSIFLVFILMMASSLCMYSLEHEAQPENFSNAFSGIWWSVSTLLTVGYGDIYPITPGGRLMAIIIAFLGVGMVAIPTGIISAGFVEYYTRIKTGSYKERDSSFVTLELVRKHPFIGKQLQNVELPEGLYPAVILRGEDVLMPYPGIILQESDSILLGSLGNTAMNCKMEEVVLDPGHPWIGYRIKDLDISRRSFIIMVKRGNGNIQPKGDTLLKAEDTVLIFEKKSGRKKK